MEIINNESNFSNECDFNNKKHYSKKFRIEKVFLFLSLFFGIIFSFIFPIFYEGDAQFHFDYASYQANTVVNRELVGSTSSFGYDQEFNSIREGDYFQKYFVNKLDLIPREQVKDKRAIRNKSIFNDVSHFFPALGVLIGYHIYPSIGSMIVTARLIMVFIYSISFYFILKKACFGKNLIFLTACTPVMIIEGFSLSYDSLSFILTMALFTAQINKIYQKKTSITFITLISIAVFFFTKENMKITLLLSAVIVIAALTKTKNLSKAIKKNKYILISIGTVIIVTGYILFSKSHGGILNFSLRMLNTLLSIENEQYTRGVLLGIMGDYTASYSLPWWCLYGYSIVYFLSIFGEIRPKISPLISYIGGSLFFINLLGTTGLYNTFSNTFRQPQDITQVIGGQLGRYYTPLLPYFIFFQNIFNFRILITEETLNRIVILWTTFCLCLLLFITIYFCYILRIPAPI
ncbi:DUF2142 domain-containing protein [Microbacterium sp.]|uniref:DUF2142 domain-containing protein n=1 Tax=Microbacterium sp. TaxID=51671 RepID=UPI0028B07305|nr:DUF2142 domain-containing protein [Microbacterium sp.]